MLYQLVGFQRFTSKKGSQLTALHLVDSKTLPNGSGHAVTTKVTALPVNVSLGKVEILFDDRGFISEVKETH